MTDCNHDYQNPVRKGRADYHCPLCDEDLTLELVLMAEAINYKPTTKIEGGTEMTNLKDMMEKWEKDKPIGAMDTYRWAMPASEYEAIMQALTEAVEVLRHYANGADDELIALYDDNAFLTGDKATSFLKKWGVE